MNAGREVHVVVPHGLTDPSRPSGGNTYDLAVCAALTAAGWTVHLRPVAGDWPAADRVAHRRLARVLDATPDGSVVLLDGLVALAAPGALVPAAHRLRTVVLVHSPLSLLVPRPDVLAREGTVLGVTTAVVVTSGWTRHRLAAQHHLDPARVHVVPPGVDPAPPVRGSRSGGALLCVGAVTPLKGHDVLVTALAGVTDRSWRCVCVGALDLAPGFVAAVQRQVRDAGLGDRVDLAGPLTGSGLAAAYAGADVLVLPSRAETYGMVVTEALARGLPVLGSDVGGVPEALGAAPDGRRPGLLTPPGDAVALAGSVRRWLDDAELRGSLREAAHERRPGLAGWTETADRVAHVLEEVAA